MAGLSATDGINNGRSRSAAAEDDGVDHIGFETPRSGVATPQPDLHDKRLPGIMSYFGQVRPASFKRLLSGTFNAGGQAPNAPPPAATTTTTTTAAAGPRDEESTRPTAELKPSLHPVGPASRSTSATTDDAPSLLAHEMAGLSVGETPRVAVEDKPPPYPTPPASQRSSVQHSPSVSSVVGLESRDTPASSRPPSLRKTSFADFTKGKSRRSSLLSPVLVTAAEFSAPACRLPSPSSQASTTPNSPACPVFPLREGVQSSSNELACTQALEKLTNVLGIKSGATSPTRAPSSALSTARPSKVESRGDSVSRAKAGTPDRLVARTPTPPGAQAPAAKGKLTIKITEAKGLRKCRDPYVVVVFQRSELISGGPRPGPGEEEEDTPVSSAVPIRSTLMQRQSSDSGRPPMAIPMRSRQSSNTSITDYTQFRTRNSRRSFTNPKWDAEAVL